MVALKPQLGAVGGAVGVGSRNAVVALKPLGSTSISSGPTRKQERRGGIETGLDVDAALKEIRKQERRGGIETGPGGRYSALNTLEAGTPWWH